VDPEVSRLKFSQEIAKLQTDCQAFVRSAGWEIVGVEYPVLAVIFTHPKTARRVGFRFTCDGWDQDAPSLTLFHPSTGIDLTWDEWPKGGWDAHHPHPVTGRPALCLPGIREYHTHTSHLNDPFVNYRSRGESYTLRHMVHRVQQRFGDTNG
jgi:hypothetical protein